MAKNMPHGAQNVVITDPLLSVKNRVFQAVLSVNAKDAMLSYTLSDYFSLGKQEVNQEALGITGREGQKMLKRC